MNIAGQCTFFVIAFDVIFICQRNIPPLADSHNFDGMVVDVNTLPVEYSRFCHDYISEFVIVVCVCSLAKCSRKIHLRNCVSLLG